MVHGLRTPRSFDCDCCYEKPAWKTCISGQLVILCVLGSQFYFQGRWDEIAIGEYIAAGEIIYYIAFS